MVKYANVSLVSILTNIGEPLDDIHGDARTHTFWEYMVHSLTDLEFRLVSTDYRCMDIVRDKAREMAYEKGYLVVGFMYDKNDTGLSYDRGGVYSGGRFIKN